VRQEARIASVGAQQEWRQGISIEAPRVLSMAKISSADSETALDNKM